MGAFKVGERFENIQDYCDYPYSHLYFHDKIIGKTITDNWQFRKIKQDIELGNLKKAEINNGYKIYEVTALSFDNYAYATKPLVIKARFVTKSVKEAEKKMIRYRLFNGCVGTHIDHEYEYSDGSGIVKMKVVAIDG